MRLLKTVYSFNRYKSILLDILQIFSQPTITCLKVTTETLEQRVKYVQS